MFGWHQGFPMLIYPLATAGSAVYTDNKVLRPQWSLGHIKKFSCSIHST